MDGSGCVSCMGVPLGVGCCEPRDMWHGSACAGVLQRA